MTDKHAEILTSDDLAKLLLEAGEHHHQAYADSDGVDPEWAMWYAGFLQTRVWDRAGTLPTRSQLVYLLVRSEAEFSEVDTETTWNQFYAANISAALARTRER